MDIDVARSRMKICKAVIEICLALCVLLVFFLYRTVADALHSPGWPTVRGVVIKSYVRRVVSGSSGGYANSWPEVHYVYSVDGIEYKGDRIFFLEDGIGYSWSKKKIEKYELGYRIPVFYKPRNPQISVLEPGGTIKGIFLSGAFHFMLIGILMLLSSALLWDHQKVKREMKESV